MKKLLGYIGIAILVIAFLANQLGFFGEFMIAVGTIILTIIGLTLWYRLFFTDKWDSEEKS